MSDLIRRENVVSRISDLLMIELQGKRLPTWNEVYNAINGIPSAEKWIPVSEALPKEKGEYLVSYHPCHWSTVSEKVVVGMDTFRGKTTWAKRKYQKVIAWMPLPEPWKGE